MSAEGFDSGTSVVWYLFSLYMLMEFNLIFEFKPDPCFFFHDWTLMEFLLCKERRLEDYGVGLVLDHNLHYS